MKIVFLGTGPSLGVPIPTCDCSTCSSSDPKDKRLRSSIYIEHLENNFIIDCGPDFRQQVLSNSIGKIDFILLTHKHNDHVGGLDDVRPFNYIQKRDMPIFGNIDTLNDVKTRFYYSFEKRPYPGAPKFDLQQIEKSDIIEIGELSIIPIEVFHGSMSIFAYRIGDFTYITDAKYIADDQIELIKGTKYLVVNALMVNRKHKMHFDLEDAIELIDKINPQKAYLTHISHNFPRFKDIQEQLPKNVYLAYDGLELTLL